MNLLTIEWQNRGINMWTIEEGTINLNQGTASYKVFPSAYASGAIAKCRKRGG